jgi:hypothetical protein
MKLFCHGRADAAGTAGDEYCLLHESNFLLLMVCKRYTFQPAAVAAIGANKIPA